MEIRETLQKIQQNGGIFEVFRFIVVGGLATFTDLAVTFILFYLFPALHENIVTTCAFFVAFFVSYFGHRHVTFQRQGSMLKFFALSFSMLALRNLIVFLLVTYLVRGIIPIIMSMVIVTIITFLVSKFLVFKDNK